MIRETSDISRLSAAQSSVKLILICLLSVNEYKLSDICIKSSIRTYMNVILC